jgi:hypothetical protein
MCLSTFKKIWYSFSHRNDLKLEKGYALVIHIYVTKDGQARIAYNGDLLQAPQVMTKSKKLLDDEILKRHGKIFKSKGKFTAVGEMKDGVLQEATIMEE